MRTTSRAVLILGAVWLAGCGTVQEPLSQPVPDYLQPPDSPSFRKIEIVSEPPGARIEVNDDFIGATPCEAQVKCDDRGRFYDLTTIRALPVQDGFTQAKMFIGSGGRKGAYSVGDTVPNRIFFDMRLRPVGDEINVNIR